MNRLTHKALWLLLACGIAGVLVSQRDAPAESAPPAPREGVAELYSQLYVRCALQLERLEAYTRAGRYPVNRKRAGAVPVFVDERGVRCAVGELMARDGQEELVAWIRKTDNYVRLHEVKEGLVLDWIRGSGLTHAECALIQPAYHWRKTPEERERELRREWEREEERRRLARLERELAPQPTIRARLTATHRFLSGQTRTALLEATRLRLPENLNFQVVALDPGKVTPALPLVQGGSWVRVSTLDARGRLRRIGSWQRFGPALAYSTPEAGETHLLVEQTQ